MQTSILDTIRATAEGQEADKIIRTCVHCGFCLATCPTYLVLGTELDSPRGRIYLMKKVMEGEQPTTKTQLHLDRCLTCLNCETTCPSGVKYGHLVDIGREMVARQVPRPFPEWLMRRGLRAVLPYHGRFTALLRLGQAVRPLAPATLRRSIPPRQKAPAWPAPVHERKMLVLEGCVQPGIAPRTNAAAARILDRLGISLIRAEGEACCGAVSFHLNAHEEGEAFMRRNIDAWWPHVEAGAEAIVMTASGCGKMVKEYTHLFRNDPNYAQKAGRISALTQDLSEVLAKEDLTPLKVQGKAPKAAFHPPCTLQHGQAVRGLTDKILRACGIELTYVPDAHLCCGSAGTYSILQKDLSQRLLDNKLKALQSGHPEVIVTANIGCQTHLQTKAGVPVRHWVELLDRA